jgi:hypothetical protein
MWLLKRHGNFAIEEMMDLFPFEFELFHYMAINDIREREKERQRTMSLS